MKYLWPLSTVTLPCVQRQNQEVGFWLLSWVKMVCLGDVLSFWLSTGMAREEFTGSFCPLSSVVSLAHAFAGLFVSFWLLGMWIWFLTQFTQNWGVPRGPGRNGAGRKKGTGQNSAFKCQWSCVLWKEGKEEFVESNGRLQQCTACRVAVTKESTAGLWNRGCISLSPARFCCCWGHCPKCFALSCAILRSLELGLLAVGYDSLLRKG